MPERHRPDLEKSNHLPFRGSATYRFGPRHRRPTDRACDPFEQHLGILVEGLGDASIRGQGPSRGGLTTGQLDHGPISQHASFGLVDHPCPLEPPGRNLLENAQLRWREGRRRLQTSPCGVWIRSLDNLLTCIRTRLEGQLGATEFQQAVREPGPKLFELRHI